MNDDGSKYIAVIFVVLLLSVTMISTIAIGVRNSGYTPKIIDSILKNADNYNKSFQIKPNIGIEKPKDEVEEDSDEERKREEDERDKAGDDTQSSAALEAEGYGVNTANAEGYGVHSTNADAEEYGVWTAYAEAERYGVQPTIGQAKYFGIGANGIEIKPCGIESKSINAEGYGVRPAIGQAKGNEIRTAGRQAARGGVVIEQSSRRVLKDENMHARCYPASVTKVLTALIAIENLPLDRVVTVPKEGAGVEGSSLYLRAGDKISVEDLLFGLMLRSGNDAAVTIAMEVAGSVEEFARLMNERATEAGAIGSHFVNPHGLQDEEHYTTAYDMAMIIADAYRLPDFCRIVGAGKKRITINGEDVVIGNKNKLLNLYDGANGVKTGYTKTSGRCLAGAAKRDGMQLISVVLNYDDMWNDTARLLDFGFDNFVMTPVEKGMLSGGANKIHYGGALEMEDWRLNMYPMRKDGSEKLVA